MYIRRVMHIQFTFWVHGDNSRKGKSYFLPEHSIETDTGGFSIKKCSYKFCKIDRKTPVPGSLF